MTCNASLLFAAAATTLAYSTPGVASSYVFDDTVVTSVSALTRKDIRVDPGAVCTFEVQNLRPLDTCAADTVLHVINLTNGEWIASSDDCGQDPASCLTITAPSPQGVTEVPSLPMWMRHGPAVHIL
jgi:hypothetical protein